MKLGEKIITAIEIIQTTQLFMTPEWRDIDVEPPNIEKDNELVLRNITDFNKMQKAYHKLTSERIGIIEKEILAKEILEILDDDFKCNVGISAFNILTAGLLDDWDFPNF